MQDPRPQMVKTKTLENGLMTKTSLRTFITVNGDKLYKYSGILDWMSVLIKLGETVSIVQVTWTFSLFFRAKIL